MSESNSVDNVTIEGHSITIRPVCVADKALEREFVHNLSVETKHYRFLGAVKDLLPAEVERLCTVDGVHTMAFVATVMKGGRETMIGVSRYAEGTNKGVREMAITVADEWQHKGLGSLLAQRLIAYAGSHGVTRLYSMDLEDNTAMRHLAKDLGMTVRRNTDEPSQVIYSLAL